MTTDTRWMIFWILTTLLLLVMVGGGAWWWRHGLKDWVTDAWYAGGDPDDLPRPGHGAQGEPATRSETCDETAGPGEPQWAEDDDATLTWLSELHDEPDDTAECTAFIDYDAPPPPRFIATTPIADGVYVPLSGGDDTLTDLTACPQCTRDEGSCTCKAYCGVIVCMAGLDERPLPVPHAGPAAWARHASPPDWLDTLFAEYLPDWYQSRALEAAA